MTDVDLTMRALGAPTRREILSLVWDRDLSVNEIAGRFSLTVATISEHLGVLRQAGLVDVTRVGTSRRYRARPQALTGLHGALEGATKWRSAENLPERALTSTRTAVTVVADVEVPTPVETTFAAFTDAATFSRWLQVPVTIEDGAVSVTMEWGTEARGRYDYLFPPHLIAMRWDFEDQNVPVPGRPLVAYLRVSAAGSGSRVEVHQLVDPPEKAPFLEGAWAMLLGRLKENVVAATSGQDPGRRRQRPKGRGVAATTGLGAGSKDG